VKWTKLRDESTKFFHSTSTERFRLNTITSLDTFDADSSLAMLKKLLSYGRNTGTG
jgi:hypothetical protein